jgi:hypothetical protein
VYGRDFIQDAVDLAEQLSEIYGHDIDVHLQKEHLKPKIKFLYGQELKDAKKWLDAVQS